jgi:molecular chaperone GrpE
MAEIDKDSPEETGEEPNGAPGAEKPAAAPEEDDPVPRLEAEVGSLKDQLLRTLAEAENQRRRSQRERDDAVKYAAAPLIKDVVEAADNLRRALDSVPAEAVAADEHLKTLMTGVEMTEKELLAVFDKHGIERIDPMGERLDPHAHEAMFELPDPDAPAGTVVQVLRVGYRMHGRLLRAAQVGIAKGGPKAPQPEAAKPAGEAAEDRAAPENGPGEAPGDNGAAPGGRIDTTA